MMDRTRKSVDMFMKKVSWRNIKLIDRPCMKSKKKRIIQSQKNLEILISHLQYAIVRIKTISVVKTHRCRTNLRVPTLFLFPRAGTSLRVNILSHP
jgi:hypothetical protein